MALRPMKPRKWSDIQAEAGRERSVTTNEWFQGRGKGNRMVQVAYILDPDGTIFVIHAMPLTTRRRRG
jgi:hypothetical protein